MDFEERTTLDRLYEELEDRDLVKRMWTLALQHAATFKATGTGGSRLLGAVDVLAVLTGDSNEMVARNLGVFWQIKAAGLDL